MTRIRAAVLSGLLWTISAAGASDQASLWVEYGGCATVIEGPVCLIGDDTRLTVWVRADPDASVEVRIDRELIPAREGIEIQAGARFELPPRGDAELVEVRAIQHGTTSARWSLRIARDDEPGALTQARAAAAQGRLDDARTILEAALDSADREGRGTMMGMLARIHMAQGDAATGEHMLAQAIDTSLDEGARFDALKNATALAFSLTHRTRDFAAARAALDRVAAPWGGPAEGEHFLDYFRGLVAYTAGDSRSALRHLGRARDRARRMGWERRALNSESMLAVQLRDLGRADEARVLLSPWRGRKPADMPPCEFANVLTNIGWIELLALEAGERARDPTPVLREAMALYREHCSAQDRVNGLVNLALARLHAGDLDEAGRHLTAGREETDSPELRMVLWAADVQARIALQQGRAQAAYDAFVELEELASATLSPSAEWRAAVGKARTLAMLGDVDAALETYAAADRALDEALYRVPFDEGRERLVATRAWATANHLELLLDAQRSDEAFALVRRARNRMLQSLRPASRLQALSVQDQAAWNAAMAAYQALHDELVSTANLAWLVPADERRRLAVLRLEKERDLRALLDAALQALGPSPSQLAELDAGALTLAFHPLPSGWAGFAFDGSTLRVLRTDCQDAGEPPQLALCLLAPFADTLSRAERLRVLPVGPLRNVDFHALRWHGGALLDLAPIAYGLDLPSTGVASSGGPAVLVADPRGDLLLSQREVRNVATILAGDGAWTLEVLEGPAADSASVRARLTAAALFHFAGHARFTGAGGWDSELLLADQGALDVADIIALPSAPALVVLSGCETATSSGDPTPDSIGLAHAFLASGTNAVLAATRPVDDVLAYRLMDLFYRAFLPSRDAATALRSAQLALRADDPSLDWSAFRLMER